MLSTRRIAIVAIVGLAESPAWLHNDWLLSAFGKRKADAIDHYLKFVSDGLHQTSIWSDLKQQNYLGGDQLLKDVIPAKAGISQAINYLRTSFPRKRESHIVERVQSLTNREQDPSEIPGAQSRPRAKPLNEYLRLEQDRNRAIARA
jgi:hypothetical protein